MDIFIDESGTHTTTGHSTSATVYVEVLHLEQFEKAILEIEKELKIESFHWAQERWQVREKFLTKILHLGFTVKVAVFDNPFHPEKIVQYVFQHLITERNIRNIYIDGEKPKWYEHKLKKVLRDKGISARKLRAVRDETSHPGIQVADAIAGLARRYYDNPEEPEAKRLFQALKKKGKLTFQFIVETPTVEKLIKKQ